LLPSSPIKRTKWTLIRKSQKNDIVKTVRLQYIVTFLITINFKSSKAVWSLNTELEILILKFTQKSLNKPIIFVFFGWAQKLNLLQMKYQFENLT
jgi:hypothetical protein